MINWNMVTPKKLISGFGSIDYLPRLLKEKKLRKPFLVLDQGVKVTSFGRKIVKILRPFKVDIFSQFTTNPTFSQVHDGLECFSKSEYGCIIAVGGGSAIDLAKVVGLAAANGGLVEDYFQGKKIKKEPVTLIAIPTTCGTGSEGSPFAVIMDTTIPKKKGIESVFLMPAVVILDPESLASLDNVMIAATGIDAFAHVVESHISKRASELTRLVSRGLLYSLREAFEKAVFEKDLLSLEKMQCIAFTARLLYPRTGLSIAHALSHPLGAYTNIHHGLAVAFFLGASLSYNLTACNKFIKDAEVAMGLASDQKNLISWISSIINKSGIGTLIRDKLQGITLPIAKIASESLLSSNIPSNPRDLNVEDVSQIIAESVSKFRI